MKNSIKFCLIFIALLFPPLLFFWGITKIFLFAIKAEIPRGKNYFWWVISFVFFSIIFHLPLSINDPYLIFPFGIGQIKFQISKVMLGQILGLIFSCFCIVATFRGKKDLTLSFQVLTVTNIFLFTLFGAIGIYLQGHQILELEKFFKNMIIRKELFLNEENQTFIFIYFVILLPIFNELLFRGLLCLKRLKSVWKVCLSDFLFSFFFASLYALFMPYFYLGLSLFLYFIRRQTRNLLPGIIIHLFSNGLIFYFL